MYYVSLSILEKEITQDMILVTTVTKKPTLAALITMVQAFTKEYNVKPYAIGVLNQETGLYKCYFINGRQVTYLAPDETSQEYIYFPDKEITLPFKENDINLMVNI